MKDGNSLLRGRGRKFPQPPRPNGSPCSVASPRKQQKHGIGGENPGIPIFRMPAPALSSALPHSSYSGNAKGNKSNPGWTLRSGMFEHHGANLPQVCSSASSKALGLCYLNSWCEEFGNFSKDIWMFWNILSPLYELI